MKWDLVNSVRKFGRNNELSNHRRRSGLSNGVKMESARQRWTSDWTDASGGLWRMVFGGVLVLTIFLAGCATTKQHPKNEVAELQNRVVSLEQELSKKDEEIRFLSGELETMGKKGSEKLSKKEPDSNEIKIQSKIGTTKQVQTALKNTGFYKGRIDGRMGPSTRKAIKEFQKANGLKADGRLGKETWAKLSAYL